MTQLDLWRKQAKQDGLLDDYDYHLGMINPPLPYQMWKMKFKSLEALQAISESDPRYFAESTFKRETELCNALGY